MDQKPTRSTFEMKTAIISKVTDENYRIKTFELGLDIKARPGQFILVWFPGVGERPMSLGNGKPVSITVANVGKCSAELHKQAVGDPVSFRGPLGTPFTLPKKANAARILLVGGGYGVVPLAYLARVAEKENIECVAVIGARKKEDLIYTKRFGNARVLVTTDDGSEGIKGNALDGVKKLYDEGERFDAVYSCGPEKMMYYLAVWCKEKNITCQVSVERYMKCGINICGACAVDGKMACTDGPVMSGEKALRLKEFGKSHLDASGKRIEL